MQAGKTAVAEDTLSPSRARLEATYRQRTPRSAALHEAARRHLPGGDTRTITYYSPYPTFMAAGQGCQLTDVDGNTYLDFLNNYTSLIHGHAHPATVAAVREQVARGTAYATPLESQLALAEAICARVRSVEQVRFCNSGTEATMSALRTAKAWTGRNKILKFEGGYHGTHDAAEVSILPVLAEAGPDEAPRPLPDTPGLFRGVLADVVVAPYNHLEATARLIEQHRDDLAAVIVEPLMGAGGTIPAEPAFLAMLREKTRACGAVLIFDEVISLRLGYGGLQEVHGIDPDLTTLGKIIGGGFPVGAFGGRGELMGLFDPQQRKLSHSGTFNGNAVTMVAGRVALDAYLRAEVERLNVLGERLRAGLRAALTNAGLSGQVTGAGSLAQVHFTAEPVTHYRAGARAAREVWPLLHLGLLNRGIFISPRGQWCLSTPMTEKEVDAAVSAFSESVAELAPVTVALRARRN